MVFKAETITMNII